MSELAKAFSQMLVTPSPMVTVSLAQPLKALARILVTFAGMVMLVRLAQPEKVLLSMLVKPFPKVTLVRLAQSEKAL
jgi:hypothetical protein